MSVFRCSLFLFILSGVFCSAQNAIHNYGSIKIHEGVAVGFHLNLINDGALDGNQGLIGFYADNTALTISGLRSPTFFDTEIAVEDNLFLEIPINVTNNGSFILGNINTPRQRSDIYLNFAESAFYVGDRNFSKVDGYVGSTNQNTFTFPIGDINRLRPLSVSIQTQSSLTKCAYFNEDPNTPINFSGSYDTTVTADDVIGVSTQEFWRLEGDTPLMATLTWDAGSAINLLGERLEDLKVVGWSKIESRWVNLGNTAVEGEFSSGVITSDPFTPNDYEIITFGGNDDALQVLETIDLDNYFLTPNNDGTNDFLVIDGLENSPNNVLNIYNRYGVLVYSKTNYQNEFDGTSNRNLVIARDNKLAPGIYFYIITLIDLRIKHQGYIYLSTVQ